MFQKDAIVRLLRDNDPATVTLLKEQLIESGSDGVAALRDLLALDDAAVTEHVRDVLERIETDEVHDEMLLFAHLFPEHVLVDKAGSARERLQALTTFMAEDLGFRGNAEEYYDT